MATLLIGGTGSTGRLLLAQLLEREVEVRAIVRSPEKLPAELRTHKNLRLIRGSILDLRDVELSDAVRGCSSIHSCLGHTLSFKGIFGPPRQLVTDATKRLYAAVKRITPGEPVRFVLMNTAACMDPAESDNFSNTHNFILTILRHLVPPHSDNEQAAAFLRSNVKSDDRWLQWVVVRPDTLIDEPKISPYDILSSPSRSAILNPGKSSRINVAHFMAELSASDDNWQRWRGQMPVLYNSDGRKLI